MCKVERNRLFEDGGREERREGKGKGRAAALEIERKMQIKMPGEEGLIPSK
jgi:hypothetical protein